MSITAKPTQTRRFISSDGIRTPGIPTTKCTQLRLSYNGCRSMRSAGRAWSSEHRREKFSQAGWGRACRSGCARVEGTAWGRLCAPLRISIFSSVVLVLIIVLYSARTHRRLAREFNSRVYREHTHDSSRGHLGPSAPVPTPLSVVLAGGRSEKTRASQASGRPAEEKVNTW